MANWIKTKVVFNKVADNGRTKKTSENYLVDALTFTEAEKRITEERAPYMNVDFSVEAVAKTKIAEIFYSEDEGKYYLVKWAFETIDDSQVNRGRPAVTKKETTLTLVQANSVANALQIFEDGMKDTLADYEVVSIAETEILDIYE